MTNATASLVLLKREINHLRGAICELGDEVDFDRPVNVAKRAHYGGGFEFVVTKSFDIIDVMMAAQQLADELQGAGR
jgi:hypothetical protein